jgi:hypothetical protein
MKPRVYVETSVISYLTSRPSRDLIVAANQQITRDWWESRRAEFELYVSQLVIQEASSGDENAAQLRLQAIEEMPLIGLTQDALVLAEALVRDGPIPQEAVEDALHIAVATVNGLEFQTHCECSNALSDRACLPVTGVRTAHHLHASRAIGGIANVPRPHCCRGATSTQGACRTL